MNPGQPLENPYDPQSDPSNAKPYYAFRIKGCLSASDWSGWFGTMTLAVDADRGETRLEGQIIDQAELYGLLARLRNLGLVLISVELLPTQD
jgi:hypothetical protein